MISCNVFTGRMAALSTRMTKRESCISGRWALRLARSYVAGASPRIIKSSKAPSFVMVGNASNVI